MASRKSFSQPSFYDPLARTKRALRRNWHFWSRLLAQSGRLSLRPSRDFAIALECFLDAVRFWKIRSRSSWRALKVGQSHARLDAHTQPTAQLNRLLAATEDGDLPRDVACFQMTTTIEETDASALCTQQWALFTKLLCGFGFLRAAGRARAKCLLAGNEEFATVGSNASTEAIRLALCHAMESRDLERLSRMLVDNVVLRRAERTARACQQWLALMTGTRDGLRKTSLADQEFGEYVRGRSIAVVAPGILREASGGEIDSHDIVYRLKYFGSLVARDPTHAGTRCDIGFLNEHHFEGLMKSRRNSEAPLAGVRWIVQKKGVPRWTASPVRVMSGWAPTALTTGTAGTLALWDLLQFEPRHVKMFGFNFYSDRSQYDESYLRRYQSDPYSVGATFRPSSWSGGNLTASHITQTFMSHVPISDFLLVQSLLECGALDAEKSTAAILRLSGDEYLSRLETMLGNW